MSGEIVPEYAEGDPILLNGKPIGTVTKVEQRNGSTFITASLSPEEAKALGLETPDTGDWVHVVTS